MSDRERIWPDRLRRQSAGSLQSVATHLIILDQIAPTVTCVRAAPRSGLSPNSSLMEGASDRFVGTTLPSLQLTITDLHRVAQSVSVLRSSGRGDAIPKGSSEGHSLVNHGGQPFGDRFRSRNRLNPSTVWVGPCRRLIIHRQQEGTARGVS